MPRTDIILLPGLDGTAMLFARFIAAAPAQFSLTPVSLPAEPLAYDQLADSIAPELPDGPVVLIAESFSGPLAIALAERHPATALVFCNSFITAPRPRALRLFVLYLRATEDRLVRESASRRMALAREMTIAEITGPHLLLQANPAGAWTAIAPFLDSAILTSARLLNDADEPC